MDPLERRVESFSLKYKSRHFFKGFKLRDKAKSYDHSRVNLISRVGMGSLLPSYSLDQTTPTVLFVGESDFVCKY